MGLVAYRGHELFDLVVVGHTRVNIARVKQSVGHAVENEHRIGLSDEDVFVESNDLGDVGIVLNERDGFASVAKSYEHIST